MSYFLLDESSVPSLRASKTVQIFITHSKPYGIDFVLRVVVLLLLRSVIAGTLKGEVSLKIPQVQYFVPYPERQLPRPSEDVQVCGGNQSHPAWRG